MIIPSLWYENYPLVLHEALASNVPVIATDAGGMSEKIKDGENGFLFPIGDSDTLYEIMDAVREEPEVLNTLKENIEDMFIPTVEQEAYSYEREYKRAVGDSPKHN